VKIRERDMTLSPGVFIEDMGVKMGLNGIDNGRIIYNNVRIPMDNMLNKFNDLSKDGKFTSIDKKPSQRFFRVAERLLSGRLCISSMCLTTTKACLYETIKYSQQRLAVGPKG